MHQGQDDQVEQGFFRREAVEAMTTQPLGSVRLATQISHQAWTLAALVIAICIVIWLFVGHYTRREHVMNESRINHLVFSSSAAVYGVPELCPIDESAPLSAISPYGYTKLVAERIIEQICQSNPSFKVAILRYFNPVGAHPSGMIGDDLTGICGNVMSNIYRVAGGIIPHLNIYGSDYPTLDGTAVRDYLHVVDLAAAHVRAFEYISHSNRSLTVNLGSGRRHSVLELVRAFEDVSGRTIPLCFKARRHGDVAECFASPKLAEQLLGWRSKLDINQACEDAWRWSKRSLLI